MNDPRYDTYMGHGPQRLLHWEHWSCPDAETYLTGIDYYEHPRLCRLKLQELYPQLGLGVPATDVADVRRLARFDDLAGFDDEVGRVREHDQHRVGAAAAVVRFHHAFILR